MPPTSYILLEICNSLSSSSRLPLSRCKVPLIQEEKSCRGEKIEENQKKRVMHKFQKRQCCRSIFSSSFTALCLPGTHSCCSELEQGSSYKEKLQSNFAKNRENHRKIVMRGVIIKQVMLADESSSCVELSVSGRCAPLTVLSCSRDPA